MATYIIGDIHGCYEELMGLLEAIAFDPASDRLWHTGDLVNGGPRSAATVRWFMEHQQVATTVLGNHDLHLLAVAYGVGRQRNKDRFDDILDASDGAALIDWLRHRPLMVEEGSRVLVHAGLLPQWTVAQARELAAEIEEILGSSRPGQILEAMYGNKPRRPDKVKTTEDRWRVTINAMTRMRVLRRRDRALDFGYKATYEGIPAGRIAWFDADEPRWRSHRVYCGHWSALGLHRTDRVVALDTGCRWGRQLTALRLDDDQIFAVPSQVV